MSHKYAQSKTSVKTESDVVVVDQNEQPRWNVQLDHQTAQLTATQQSQSRNIYSSAQQRFNAQIDPSFRQQILMSHK